MYRQILVLPAYQKYQHIFWRSSSHNQVRVKHSNLRIELCPVFSTSCSSIILVYYPRGRPPPSRELSRPATADRRWQTVFTLSVCALSSVSPTTASHSRRPPKKDHRGRRRSHNITPRPEHQTNGCGTLYTCGGLNLDTPSAGYCGSNIGDSRRSTQGSDPGVLSKSGPPGSHPSRAA